MLSDDGDSPLSPLKKVPKNSLNGGQKKLKPRPTIIESSDESDHNNIKNLKACTKNKTSDTELEENENKNKTSEEELGKLCV